MVEETPKTREEKIAAEKEKQKEYKKLVTEMKKIEKKYGYDAMKKWFSRRGRKQELIVNKESIEKKIEELDD